MNIETDNLRIIPGNLEMLHTAIQGNDALATRLNTTVPNNWTEFGIPALKYSAEKLNHADEAGWWTYFAVHKKDNMLIGSGGYKGKPADGGVEIGYEIAADYRNRGLATEFLNALVKNAFNKEHVSTIIAHTLGEENASVKVLTKCGFTKTAEINDPDDGLIWKWELKRPEK